MGPALSEDEIDDLLYLARVGETEEYTAVQRGLCERERCSITELLEAAKDVETSGNGVLHMAAANGHDVLLTLLLNELSKPTPQNPAMLAMLNAQNKSGNTALHWAALNGHLESVKKLLENGADPTITNHKGHDPIYEAEINDRKDVVEWVLKEGGEGLEEGFGGDGEAGEPMEEDANENLSSESNQAKLEDAMKGVDIKEDGPSSTT